MTAAGETELAPGRVTVVVRRDPWLLDGVVPQLWGSSHTATGPDGAVHRAPGFWRLWLRLHRRYPGRVRVPIQTVEQDAPQRGRVRPPRRSYNAKRGGNHAIHDHA